MGCHCLLALLCCRHSWRRACEGHTQVPVSTKQQLIQQQCCPPILPAITHHSHGPVKMKQISNKQHVREATRPPTASAGSPSTLKLATASPTSSRARRVNSRDVEVLVDEDEHFTQQQRRCVWRSQQFVVAKDALQLRRSSLPKIRGACAVQDHEACGCNKRQ